MSRQFFTGWSEDEIAMHGTQWSDEEIQKLTGMHQAPMGINKVGTGTPTIDVRLFSDKEAGFTFDIPMWKNMWAADRDRYAPDALAHRNEAMRRMVICRLESKKKEADHWVAQMRFLEKQFRIPEITNE